jgi:hypothetical protein
MAKTTKKVSVTKARSAAAPPRRSRKPAHKALEVLVVVDDQALEEILAPVPPPVPPPVPSSVAPVKPQGPPVHLVGEGNVENCNDDFSPSQYLSSFAVVGTIGTIAVAVHGISIPVGLLLVGLISAAAVCLNY